MGKSKKPGKLIFVGYDIGKEKWKTIYQENIIKLAKQQKSVHEIRVALNLPYSDNSNARIAYYVKKYKDN